MIILLLVLIKFSSLAAATDKVFSISDEGSHGFGVVVYQDRSSVCVHPRFGNREAGAICHSMGYDLGASRWWMLSDVHGLRTNEDLPVTVTDISCLSDEWSSCSFSNSSNHCSHQQDLIVNCVNTIPELFEKCVPRYRDHIGAARPSSIIIHWKPFVSERDCLIWCYMCNECSSALIGNDRCFIIGQSTQFGSQLDVTMVTNDSTRWRIADKIDCENSNSSILSPQNAGLIAGIMLMVLSMVLYYFIGRKCRPYHTEHEAHSHVVINNSYSTTPPSHTTRVNTRSSRTSDVGVQIGVSRSVNSIDTIPLCPDTTPDTALDTAMPDILLVDTPANPPHYEDTVIVPCPTYDEVMLGGGETVESGVCGTIPIASETDPPESGTIPPHGIDSLTRCSF